MIYTKQPLDVSAFFFFSVGHYRKLFRSGFRSGWTSTGWDELPKLHGYSELGFPCVVNRKIAVFE